VGPPGQMRLDALPSQVCRKGTIVWLRSTIAADGVMGYVAIQDTVGATASAWRNFGTIFGANDGETPAIGFPLLGSALETEPLRFGQTTVNVNADTYTMQPADYINTYVGFAGTPGANLTVTCPTVPGSQVTRMIVGNSLTGGYSLTLTAGGSLTVTIPYETAMEVVIVGDNILPVPSYGNAQPTRAGQLTSGAGSAGSSTSDVGSSFSQTTLNNNFATLVAKVNALEAMLHNLGLST
jgi:hypothetical protein